MDAAAAQLADGPEGAWVESVLRAEPEPRVVGLSILYSGQVVWALAVAIVARRLWPQALVVAGGPHVTALAPEIAADARYGRRSVRSLGSGSAKAARHRAADLGLAVASESG